MTGTDIRFLPPHGRNGVRWAASATKGDPEIINIHYHPFWNEGTDEQIILKLYRLLSHETIHHTLWDILEEAGTKYDIGRRLFLDITPDDYDCYMVI